MCVYTERKHEIEKKIDELLDILNIPKNKENKTRITNIVKTHIIKYEKV